MRVLWLDANQNPWTDANGFACFEQDKVSAEDLFVVFMTQLFPSAAYPFRAQLRALVYQAIDD